LNSFVSLLRRNHNYRNTWMGQVVSEVGDHFNNIAVFSLVVTTTKSGLVVSGVMLARAIPAILIGPLAGVVLDRFDRKRVMIASDLARAVIAAAFVFTIHSHNTWLLYVLSGLLMVASPFFSAGRSAILPAIATNDELHTANSLTQITQTTTLAVGAFLGGTSVGMFGFTGSFLFNAVSFLFSALCISRLRLPGRGFRPAGAGHTEIGIARPWHEYKEGLRYMRSRPLILGIGGLAIGWATGGGAAQILFSIFGELVFHRGAAGIGAIWGCAGIGLLAGSLIAWRFGPHIGFEGFKHTMTICFLVHGISYIVFSQMRSFPLALVFIALSRAASGVNAVFMMAQLLRHVDDRYRGRVFATIDSAEWSVMLLSMTAAGIASQSVDARLIGAVAGALSATTAIFWGWANVTGRLPEPQHAD